MGIDLKRIRDKKCNDCPSLIMRMSVRCYKCSGLLRRGIITSVEVREKIRKNNARYWLGKKRPPMSKDQRIRIGLKSIGRLHDEKFKEAMRKKWLGEGNPNWVGGLAFRKKENKRNDSAYIAWSQKVKNRDKGLCKLQNENCTGYKVVHHILPWRDYPEERYNLNNGITLCQYHHPRKRIDEQRLIPELQKLVTLN